MIVGWALAYLVHVITGQPEITEYWARWILGIAVIIIASLFRPQIYRETVHMVTNGGERRDYWYSDNE
jgi:hypothetical protein